MRFLLIVQGEGRGHLTQAIALTEILENNGHTVAGALIGTANGRDIPAFFHENFKSPVIPFSSPYLAYNQKTKALDVPKTICNTLLNLRAYRHSLRKIQFQTKKLKPDVIINFYDVLGGLHQFLFRPKIPMICIAHQYLLLHPNFHHPKNHWLDQQLVNTNTRITALGAAKKLALSFTPFDDDKNQKIFPIPPLLRSDLSRLSTSSHNYLLAYVTQHSLAEQIIKWHDTNPHTEVHCFWDNPDYDDTFHYSPNLHFHKINGRKFLEMMQNCRGLVTTAGFESVCEAMYLGKPVLMIPVPKHYEQACNAIDARRAGAGITANNFDLTAFIDYLPAHKDISHNFRAWHSRSNFIFMREIEDLFNTPKRQTIWQTIRQRELIPQFVKRFALALVSPLTRN
ncbi:glycosyltransferase family protein [Emticicia sp. BO119]|uniref:glycosyltransferase family protein n=1 Tax=Emticicia sp. BO119 TaxID=2757768 RepID=UPI0015EFFF34|nr:glycosyltransferase family protein [Emticicia sp. BO119]MBA4852343.1 glycosyl transferase [Emticicia sp. BO119]